MGRGNVGMSSAALLVFAVSSLAGTVLRAWAFALTSLGVVLAVLVVLLFQGEPLFRSLILGLKLLVLMQTSYVLGLFVSHFVSQMVRRRKARPLSDRSRMGGEPPPS